ncbi:glycosyltransferase family 9 protein [Spirosoma montaniterrae]|nr:glycosyltransferase family 9 protein [Spirosoma montaniterrae]
MKILILRFSSIGDIVLTTPVVRCLKQQLPGVSVHFCTKRAYQPLIEHNPHIGHRHYLDDRLPDLIRQLRAERFDYVIDLHNNLRTRLIKTALGVRSYTVDKLNLRKWLYVRFKVDVMPDLHIVDRYLATVVPLGVRNDDLGLDHFIPDHEQVPFSSLPITHQFGYVAYAIGGQHATKRLPASRMVDLCRQLNEPVILLGGTNDRAAGEQVVALLGSKRVYNACGLYSINQSASLIQQARMVFSHDTGLMHIAAAFQKTVYSIWGNTTPRLGMYPYKTKFIVLENQTIHCRPCSKIGHDYCPLGHFRCMIDLPIPADVLSSAQQKTIS